MSKRININPHHDEDRTCGEDLVASFSMGKNLQFELMYTSLWNFYLMPKDENKFKTLGERVYVDNEKEMEFLKKYHGICIQNHELNSEEEFIRVLKEELNKDIPVVIDIDMFWCPWAIDMYQNIHHPHFVLIIGYDEVTNNLWCVDSISSDKETSISIDHVINGSKIYSTFNLVEVEKCEWKDIVLESVNGMINPLLENTSGDCNRKNTSFDYIRMFAKEISESLDIRIEADGLEEQFLWKAPIFNCLINSGKNRRKFAIALEYIAQQFNVPQLNSYVDLFKELGRQWDMIEAMMMKVYYLSNPTNIIKRIEKKLIDVADLEEQIAYELIDFTNEGVVSSRNIANTTNDVQNITENKNYVEQEMEKIWCKILGKKEISIDLDFFEFGGNSLKATSLVSEVNKVFNTKMPLRIIFQHSTIRTMSKYIDGIEKSRYANIEPIEIKPFYSVSSAQKRLYILNQFDISSTNYNMPIAFYIKGNLEYDRLSKAFELLIKKHEILRTSFQVIDGQICQMIHGNFDFNLDITNSLHEDVDNIISSFILPFDLSQAPLIRAKVVNLNDCNLLICDMHHIISDGISIAIVINELMELYYKKNSENLRVQYKDFVAWQNKSLNSQKINKLEQYWLNTLSGKLPVLDLVYDYPRPAIQSFSGDNVEFEVDEKLYCGLKQIAKKTGTTTYMILLAIYNILLAKYTNQEDIIVGSPIAGRQHVDLENMIGMFVNTLAIRTYPEGNKTFKEFLKEVKDICIKAYKNQDYQFEDLIEKLSIKRDLSRNPLFDTMFVLRNIELNSINKEDFIFESYDYKSKISKFDITLIVSEKEDKLQLSIEYCTELFALETINAMANHFTKIVKSVINDVDIKIREIDILSDKEKNKLLYEFNNTFREYPHDKTIHNLFEEQVEKTPNAIAVIFQDNKLTYRELNEKSNSLAKILRDKGIKSDSIVSIMLEKSIETIIGIIGILKAGGAYLPIDPSYPRDRIEYMLSDSESEILLSSENTLGDIQFNGEVIDLFKDDLFNAYSGNLREINNSNNLAYVIYTSGTTGNPKGVMIEHKSLVNYITYAKDNYCIEEKLYVPLYTSIAFDLTVTSIFMPLISGNTIVCIEEKDIKKLIERVYEVNNKSIVKVTPAHLRLMKEFGNINKSIKRFIVGGEELREDLAKFVSNSVNNDIEIINEYGPTEATVGCITHTYNYKKLYKNSILIGKPINNTKIYILNEEKKISPIGILGEIYISGDGLARGYLNNEELTNEKFVDNPFDQGKKMYRTGDFARWKQDGNIEFFGRIDNQVKVRGFRIELEEIENRILQHNYVKEVTVIVKENNDNEKCLCAYIVSNDEISNLNMREYLRKVLPEYMIPTYFMKIDKIPLTINGKVDASALPHPNVNDCLNEYKPPTNKIEEVLSSIWGQILNLPRVSIDDNFFEIGGHSLKATVLISKIHKELNKEITLKDLFASPTIKGLSKIIENVKDEVYKCIESIELKDYYEVSSAQKRMYIMQKFDQGSIAYNIPEVFKIEGFMDKSKIADTFRKLVERHEALRTYFETVGDKIVQKIDVDYKFKLERKVELRSIEEVVDDFVKPFDLGKSPLFRAEVIDIQGKNYLVIDMHHIISDGVSMNVLIKEFTKLYNGEDLEPLKIQYKDFAAWQNNFLKSEEMKKQEQYWINMFNDEVPVLNLPYDYERPNIQSFEGDSVRFEVDKNLKYELNNLANRNGATIHMIILSAFSILLSKYSGQEDIIVGIPVAGRPHIDLENVVGMFVNVLPLRNKPERNKRYIDFLYEVKESSLKAYDNQSYQIENLVEKLNIKRDLSRNPLFDVMLNTLNMDIQDTELNQLLKPYHDSNKVSKVDLELTLMEGIETLNLTLTYCNKLFDKNTICIIIDDFIDILKIISTDENIMLDNIINNESEDLFELDDNLFLD